MRSAARSPAATRTRAAASWLRDASASIPAVPPASGRYLITTRLLLLHALPTGRRREKMSHISARPSSLTHVPVEWRHNGAQGTSPRLRGEVDAHVFVRVG